MKVTSPAYDWLISHVFAAVELDIAIGASYMEAVRGPGGEIWPPRNSVAMIDRHGEIIYNYAKVHTCQFSALEALHTGGRRVYTGVLNTRSGTNVTVASVICFDREQMETARIARQAGAEVLLVPNACGLSDDTLDQFAVRAMENAMATAMANYADIPEWSDSTNGVCCCNHVSNTHPITPTITHFCWECYI